MSEIKVGDKVRLTAKFLRGTGQRAETRKRWTVTAIDARHGWAVVDEKAHFASNWYSEEEQAADPSLVWRRIALGNLEVCK